MSNNKDKEGSLLPVSRSLVNIKANSVILDTIKKAEDDNSLILRFYEYGNQRDTVKVELLQRIKNVLECNLVEKGIKEVMFDKNKFEFKIRPYEIRSFKISRYESS